MSTPRLAITTAVLSPLCNIVKQCAASWGATSGCWSSEGMPTGKYETVTRYNKPDDNLGVTGSLQWLYERTTAPIIACIHSDVEIFERGWDERVLKEFDDPKVGVVGFGGALQLGDDDIYRIPYRLTQLRRIDYCSNTRDAETHGERFTGECDVATLDGFALIVRRELLDKWVTPLAEVQVEKCRWAQRGWPIERYPFHNYDNALCLEAHRQGFRVRLVGIDCQHHGGVTSTSPAGQAHWQAQGTTDAAIHEQSHLALYEDGRGILPLRVK